MNIKELQNLTVKQLQKKATETWIKKTYSNINKLKPKSKHKPNKKIRLGYYSADFRQHAVGKLIVNLFESHDKSKFEIFSTLKKICSPKKCFSENS